MRRRPKDARLVFDNGWTISLDLVYIGWVDGAHMWETRNVVAPDVWDAIIEGRAWLKVGRLPAHTGIRLQIATRGDTPEST